MTSKLNCFGPGFLKWVYPKNPPGFLGTCPGVRTLAVPPIHAVSSHAVTSKDPFKFRSIFSDNLQPIATGGKKACGTLLVDIGCSSKRVPTLR